MQISLPLNLGGNQTRVAAAGCNRVPPSSEHISRQKLEFLSITESKKRHSIASDDKVWDEKEHGEHFPTTQHICQLIQRAELKSKEHRRTALQLLVELASFSQNHSALLDAKVQRLLSNNILQSSGNGWEIPLTLNILAHLSESPASLKRDELWDVFPALIDILRNGKESVKKMWWRRKSTTGEKSRRLHENLHHVICTFSNLSVSNGIIDCRWSEQLIPILVEYLQRGTDEHKNHVARILANLVAHGVVKDGESLKETVAPLISQVNRESSASRMPYAIRALAYASRLDRLKRTVLTENGLRAATTVLCRGADEQKTFALQLISNLVDAAKFSELEDAEILAQTLPLLQGTNTSHIYECVRALRRIAERPEASMHFDFSAALAPLVALLRDSRGVPVHRVALVLFLVCQDDETTEKVGLADAIPALIQVIQNGSPEAQENAALALMPFVPSMAWTAEIVEYHGFVVIARRLQERSNRPKEGVKECEDRRNAFSTVLKAFAENESAPVEMFTNNFLSQLFSALKTGAVSVQHDVLYILRNLFRHEAVAECHISQDCLADVVAFFTHTNTSLQTLSIDVVAALSRWNTFHDVIRITDCVPQLMRVLVRIKGEDAGVDGGGENTLECIECLLATLVGAAFVSKIIELRKIMEILVSASSEQREKALVFLADIEFDSAHETLLKEACIVDLLAMHASVWKERVCMLVLSIFCHLCTFRELSRDVFRVVLSLVKVSREQPRGVLKRNGKKGKKRAACEILEENAVSMCLEFLHNHLGGMDASTESIETALDVLILLLSGNSRNRVTTPKGAMSILTRIVTKETRVTRTKAIRVLANILEASKSAYQAVAFSEPCMQILTLSTKGLRLDTAINASRVLHTMMQCELHAQETNSTGNGCPPSLVALLKRGDEKKRLAAGKALSYLMMNRPFACRMLKVKVLESMIDLLEEGFSGAERILQRVFFRFGSDKVWSLLEEEPAQLSRLVSLALVPSVALRTKAIRLMKTVFGGWTSALTSLWELRERNGFLAKVDRCIAGMREELLDEQTPLCHDKLAGFLKNRLAAEFTGFLGMNIPSRETARSLCTIYSALEKLLPLEGVRHRVENSGVDIVRQLLSVLDIATGSELIPAATLLRSLCVEDAAVKSLTSSLVNCISIVNLLGLVESDEVVELLGNVLHRIIEDEDGEKLLKAANFPMLLQNLALECSSQRLLNVLAGFLEYEWVRTNMDKHAAVPVLLKVLPLCGYPQRESIWVCLCEYLVCGTDLGVLWTPSMTSQLYDLVMTGDMLDICCCVRLLEQVQETKKLRKIAKSVRVLSTLIGNRIDDKYPQRIIQESYRCIASLLRYLRMPLEEGDLKSLVSMEILPDVVLQFLGEHERGEVTPMSNYCLTIMGFCAKDPAAAAMMIFMKVPKTVLSIIQRREQDTSMANGLKLLAELAQWNAHKYVDTHPTVIQTVFSLVESEDHTERFYAARLLSRLAEKPIVRPLLASPAQLAVIARRFWNTDSSESVYAGNFLAAMAVGNPLQEA